MHITIQHEGSEELEGVSVAPREIVRLNVDVTNPMISLLHNIAGSVTGIEMVTRHPYATNAAKVVIKPGADIELTMAQFLGEVQTHLYNLSEADSLALVYDEGSALDAMAISSTTRSFGQAGELEV